MPDESTSVADLSERNRQEFRKIFAETGAKTLNALLILSGGAAVSFLAFLGNAVKDVGVAERLGSEAAKGFIAAMQFFVASVSCCIVGHGTTYFSHGAYHFCHHKTGHVFGAVTIVLEVACVALFVYGSYDAIDALSHVAQSLPHR